MECVALRYFNVYGRLQRCDAYGNVIPIFAHRMLAGEPLTIYGDGEQTRDFVNVEDVARANLLAATAAGRIRGVQHCLGHAVTINRAGAADGEGQRHQACGGPWRSAQGRRAPQPRRRLGGAQGVRLSPAVGLEPGLVRYMEWARQAGV
jgi:UDP-glucose 4-epimerase